ncbi:hypothetical protein [Thiolapillus sp.]
MKNLLILIPFILTITACSPHPGAGLWKAEGENDLGIKVLTMAYEGKAVFSSTRGKVALWHCFWNGADRQSANLDCTPSTNPDAEERFVFTVREDGTGELSQQGKIIAKFVREEGNPSIN